MGTAPPVPPSTHPTATLPVTAHTVAVVPIDTLNHLPSPFILPTLPPGLPTADTTRASGHTNSAALDTSTPISTPTPPPSRPRPPTHPSRISGGGLPGSQKPGSSGGGGGSGHGVQQ